MAKPHGKSSHQTSHQTFRQIEYSVISKKNINFHNFQKFENFQKKQIFTIFKNLEIFKKKHNFKNLGTVKFSPVQDLSGDPTTIGEDKSQFLTKVNFKKSILTKVNF